MSYNPPPPPPDKFVPMTPDELAEHDKIWEIHDRKMIGIYQKKLDALGYNSSFENAKLVYEDEERTLTIDNEYHELKSQHLINEMIAEIESIHRRLLG